MPNEIIPAPAAPDGDDQHRHDAGHAAGAKARPGTKRRRRKGMPLSREDCLAMLGQLPSLVTLGILSPAQANSIRGVLGTILAETRESYSGGSSPLANENLIRILREQSELLNLLEPLLTDEQMSTILKEFTDES
jgi:hypothetical protein